MPFAADPIWEWGTSGYANDVFFVTVMARSIGSPLAHEVIATPQMLVIADVQAATGVNFTMDYSRPARVGTPYHISAWGVGGSGEYEYRFRFRGEDDWLLEQPHSTDNAWQWNPDLQQLGQQFVEVCARSLGSPVECEVTQVIRVEVREGVEQIWERIYGDYLADDLWLNDFVEDAAHTLHLPMNAAFAESSRSHWRAAFADQFQRFLNSGDHIEVQLYRLEYYYLASKFARLALETENDSLIPVGLEVMLSEEVARLWTEEPAWLWDSPSFPGGIKQRTEWKLNVEDPPFHYYAALTDHDMFLFAIAAELKAAARLREAEVHPVWEDVLSVARQVIETRVEWLPHGGWLYQRGFWSDHPENSRAGHPSVAPDLPPAIVVDIARDVSHSMRWPLWLQSFEQAATPNSPERAYYYHLRSGLNLQFTEKVLVQPTLEFPGYRMRNYMDGYNGIYRYQYYTAGEGRGTDPYQLSGALMFGLWAFLESAEVVAAYRGIAANFSIEDQQLSTYVGANTMRTRHPLETWPAAFENGDFEFLALLASELPITI